MNEKFFAPKLRLEKTTTTPRTDEKIATVNSRCGSGNENDNTHYWELQAELRVLCQTLERELTAAQQSIREMEGDAKRRRDQLIGMNLLSEKEVEYWQDALTKVQADGSVVLPPGSNVLCRMAMATAIDAAMDSSSPAGNK